MALTLSFRDTEWFIPVDVCSERLNRLRNSDLDLTYSFLWQNVCSKFRNTGKLIPFGFEGSKFVDMKAQKGQLTFS